MRKSVFMGAACLCFGGLSQAQTSVQFAGVVDASVEYAKGSSSVSRLRDGNSAASRWIMKGEEDLGGRTRAAFLLESGFNVDTGTEFFGNNRLFGRQAWVGLQNPAWGEVRLGRQYSPSFNGLIKSDAFLVNSNVSPINLLTVTEGQGAASSTYFGRFDNMIGYRTPAFAGFSGEFAYAPGEAAGSARSGRQTGANVQYANGDLYLYYAYQGTNAGTAAAPAASPTRTDFHFIGGTYRLGPVLLGLTAVTSESNAPASNLARHYLASAVWNVNGTNVLRAEAVKRNVQGSNLDPYGVTLGWDYLLSKRTSLYTRAVYVHNEAGGGATLNAIPITARSGDSGRSISFGVRHNF